MTPPSNDDDECRGPRTRASVRPLPGGLWRPWVLVLVLVLTLALNLASCASLDPDYEEPSVTLQSFRMLPAEGMTPRFEVGLTILNPNATDLDLAGVVYSISVQDHELVKGAGKDFPVIEAYSEGSITLQASANLLGGIQLFTDLARDNPSSLEYRFDAKLDLKGIYPSIKVSESGTFSANPRPAGLPERRAH